MATHSTRIVLLAVACLGLSACAAGDPRTSSKVTQVTTAEAARLLGCEADEVAICIDSNCELEDYRCADRNDVREMFNTGESRH